MESEKTLRKTLIYTPVPSRFGTSGVRALVRDLTDLEVYSLTLGTLRYLEGIGKVQQSECTLPSVAIPLAGDLRSSTGRLLQTAARAIMDAGYQVDYVGRIPTPALTFYALTQGVASFMVTGSHIPADRNGVKANRCDGEVLKADEPGIIEAVETVRQMAYRQSARDSRFDERGRLKPEHRVDLPAVNRGAEQLYAERYRQVFPRGGLKGKRIVFFEYTAVGRDLLPAILEEAGAQVIRAERSDEFVPIDTEAISDAHLDMLRSIVSEHRQIHGPIDALVSTDGDSDRPLVVGVEDPQEKGPVTVRFFPGDLLGAVVADYLGADSVAVPISVSPAVHEYFQEKGVMATQTRIGSPFVIQSMREALEQGYKRVVAWEANGGFLVGSDIVLKDGTLKALPTRDAILPILCVLHAAAEQGATLSELFEQLPQWYGRADLIDDFPQTTSQKILAYFAPFDEHVKWMEFEEERIILCDVSEKVIRELRPQEPEGQEALVRKEALEGLFTQHRGFDEIVKINTQDGIRCFFGNEEIAHIRPSGNAPQLRIYAQARTQARADAIARMGVAEPDGILRNLQTLIENARAPHSLSKNACL